MLLQARNNMVGDNKDSLDLRAELSAGLIYHPRVTHQGLWTRAEDRHRIADALPQFVPFGGKRYQGCTWILDWDHRLPSRHMVVRLSLYYSDVAREAGLRTLKERHERIAREDLFPEFDVADFAGLIADETYEAELEVGGTPPGKFRLASQWKRDVRDTDGRKAEAIARQSDDFKKIASVMTERATGLGDLEAAEWASPSETGHERWGIEVWYLRSFNGMVGEGTAFLVDLEASRVISQREFQFRAG
ncbi:MAG: hypothetical protein SGI86_02445 [Deltaproteobacteria bacterium]|nr:hypothetical protein [Deltaproteobacteria bacterium]